VNKHGFKVGLLNGNSLGEGEMLFARLGSSTFRYPLAKLQPTKRPHRCIRINHFCNSSNQSEYVASHQVSRFHNSFGDQRLIRFEIIKESGYYFTLGEFQNAVLSAETMGLGRARTRAIISGNRAMVQREYLLIDLGSAISSEEVNCLEKKKRGFSEWYGQNWDVFGDSITNLVEMPLRLMLKDYDQFESRPPHDVEPM
jgi:hypothetical protein